MLFEILLSFGVFLRGFNVEKNEVKVKKTLTYKLIVKKSQSETQPVNDFFLKISTNTGLIFPETKSLGL